LDPGCGDLDELLIFASSGAPAAVANAIFHATDKRVRDPPITPDKLM